MSLFVNVGRRSVNVEAIALVNWTYNDAGTTANIYFIGSDETLLLKDEEAATLSNAISALEARSERDLDREYTTPTLYDDSAVLSELEAAILRGPSPA